MKEYRYQGEVMKRSLQSIFLGMVLASACGLDAKAEQKTGARKTVAAIKGSWKKVQEEAQFGIVQVFSYLAEPDFLKPYAKDSGEGRGSGALVDGSRGLILTSFHVIESAVEVGIQMPLYSGKRMIRAKTVGVCPDYDIALVQIDPAICAEMEKQFGALPTIPLGDSDNVHRSEQLLGLGFPLGDESLKSVTGVVSGYEHVVSRNRLRFHQSYAIQVSTPLNPGSSGGPVLNKRGQIVGICMAGADAQNVGYVVPINYYKMLSAQLQQGGLIRKPFLGVSFCRAKDNELAQLLGNPVPAGCYLSYVSPTGLAGKAGLKEGDMIYSINGLPVDPYGCIAASGTVGDRLFVQDYLASFPLGSGLVMVIYRQGVRHELRIDWNLTKQQAIRWRYTPYDPSDYEIVGGLLVQELSLNIISLFEHTQAGNDMPNVRSRLAAYKEDAKREEPVLVVTQVLPSSAAYSARSCGTGSIITHVNDTPVRTLEEMRAVLRQQGDKKFVVFKTDENEPLALSVATIVQSEAQLAQSFGYQTTPAMKQLIAEKS